MILRDSPNVNQFNHGHNSHTNPSSSQTILNFLAQPEILGISIVSVFIIVGGIIRVKRAAQVSTTTIYTVPSVGTREGSVENLPVFGDWCRTEVYNRRPGIWKKLPRRFWSFYIDALMIPSYRKEWGKYKVWNHRSPLRNHKHFASHETHKWKKEQTKKRSLHASASLSNILRKDCAPVPHNHVDCQRIRINVAGTIYETQRRTLNRYPETLLGDPRKRLKYYDPDANEYYFDRHRQSFETILHFYQSGGRFHRPDNIAADVLLDDAKFFELGNAVVLQYQIDEGLSYATEPDDILPEDMFMRKIWLLFDFPESSLQARIVALLSVSTIVISITLFCIETMEELAGKRQYTINSEGVATMREFDSGDFQDAFFLTESVCSVWFTIEFLARLLSAPAKFAFMKSILNLIDLLAILPSFSWIVSVYSESRNQTFTFVRVIRLVRVFRILKLSRHYKGLKILGKTLHASLNELILLIFFVCIGIILFSTLIYFAENGEDNSDFQSIPDGFWWALITITTVGYGDLVPSTAEGKIIGALCAVAGVLTIALPVPVIVSNFNFFYHQAVDEKDLSWIKISYVPPCPYRPIGPSLGQKIKKKQKNKRNPWSTNVQRYSSDEEFGELKEQAQERENVTAEDGERQPRKS